MIKSDLYSHIEWINPDRHTRSLLGRISSFVISGALFAFCLIWLAKILLEQNVELIFIGMFFLLVTTVPTFWIWSDNINFFLFPLKRINVFGKILIDGEGIATVVRTHEIRKLKWKDITIIEKYREGGEKHIILITNILNEKIVVCDDKKRNYILIPARPSLEQAVKRFSNMDITLADPEINRYILNQK